MPRVIHQWSRGIPFSLPSYFPLKEQSPTKIDPHTKALALTFGIASPFDPYSDQPYGYFGSLQKGSIPLESYITVYGDPKNDISPTKLKELINSQFDQPVPKPSHHIYDSLRFAKMYLYGEKGRPQNPLLGLEYLQIGISKSDPDSLFEAYQLYSKPLPLNTVSLQHNNKAQDTGPNPSLSKHSTLSLDSISSSKPLKKILVDHSKAFDYLIKAGKAGSPEAQYQIGMHYLNGYPAASVSSDNKKSQKWFSRASEIGYTPAMLQFGLGLLNKHIVTDTFRESEITPTEQAQRLILFPGANEIPTDAPKLAMYWFRYGAYLGDPECMTNYGMCLFTGTGILPCFKSAVIWFQNAAHCTSPSGMYNLAACHIHGTGIQIDHLRALSLLHSAAASGHPEAAFAMGAYLFSTESSLRDVEAAILFYSVAAENGHASAQLALAHIYKNQGQRIVGEPHHLAECRYAAALWFESAAYQGIIEAQFETGKCYIEGFGVEKDISTGLFWLKMVRKDPSYTMAHEYYANLGSEIQSMPTKSIKPSKVLALATHHQWCDNLYSKKQDAWLKATSSPSSSPLTCPLNLLIPPAPDIPKGFDRKKPILEYHIEPVQLSHISEFDD